MGKAPKCKFTWMQSLWVLAGLILLGGALLSLFGEAVLFVNI